MKMFKVWLLVNDDEYVSQMKVRAHSCKALEEVEDEDGRVWYTVCVDGKVLFFDEFVEVEEIE